MIYLFLPFAVLLVWLSFKSFLGGVRYLRFFRSELAKQPSGFTPFVTVIAPCRGIERGMERNFENLFLQDHPAYEIIFVVDDKEDPCVPVIEKVAQNRAQRSKLIVAPNAIDCAQKVENLRAAVLHASAESEVFVFVDSDVRPSRDWLRSLVGPLVDNRVGAATGYRWFLAEPPTFASEMRSVWNASIASALGPDTRTNFCWGGSMAIRRATFEQLNVRDRLKGTLSDDFTVTRILNEAGLPIVFVPRAVTPSVSSCRFRELVEFTTRQMKITRVYAPKLWLMSLVGSGLFTAVMITGCSIILFSGENSAAIFPAIATLVLVSIFSIGKAWLRLSAVGLAMPEYRYAVGRQAFTQNTLWVLTPALFFYNSLAALLSRRITWRGITYELKSPTETVIIRD